MQRKYNKPVNKSFMLDESVAEKVEQKVKKEGKTFTEWIHGIIDKYIRGAS